MSYQQCFITVSDDCPADAAQVPPVGAAKRSKATIEYDLLTREPYRYDQNALNYAVYTAQKLQTGQQAEPPEVYLSKGRPCLRASSLIKRYGWGAHYDDGGRIRLVGLGSDAYAAFAEDPCITVLKGMRSKRA